MAAIDLRTGDYAIDPQGRGNFNIQQEDLKGQTRTNVRYFDAGTLGMVTTNTYKVATIGAGTLISAPRILVKTAEGATGTIDLGDSAGGTTFDDGLNVNATAGTLEAASTLTYKYYGSDDYLLITVNNDLDTAEFYLIWESLRLV